MIPLLLALSFGIASDDPAGARAAAEQARSLLGSGRASEALEPARRAAALDPRSGEGDLLVGYALLETGQPEEALASFERASAARPGSVEARGGIAMACGTLGDPRAEKEFANVLAAAPTDPRYRHRYAEYLWLTRDTDLGNREMERAIAQAPSDPSFQLIYGMQLYDQGRFLDAARLLKSARKAGAGARYAGLPYLLGTAELENGHFAEAERALREAIESEPGKLEARLFLGRVLLLTARPADARRELSLAAAAAPGSALVQLDLGRAAEALHDLDAAEAAYRRCLALDPSLSRAHYLLGALLSRQRRADEAKKEMAIYAKGYEEEQALQLRQRSKQVEINLALKELREGHLEEALAHFARHPDDVEALRGSSVALSRLGRRSEAVAALEKALALAPEDSRLRYELRQQRQANRAP